MSGKYTIIFIIFLLLYNHTHAIVPERTGWWKFDNPSDITEAEDGHGSALTLQGSHSTATGPEEGNGAVLIGPGSYYKMKHSIPLVSPEKFVNEYSLQFDFKIPSGGIWHSFFQTTIKNNNDGDFFINPSGNIGVAAVGYSGYVVNPGEWYRLIISVKNGSHFACYLDGSLLMKGITQPVDGRFSLDSLLLIFADENSEDGNIYCSELSVWDKALTAEEAKELAGFGHDFTPFLMTGIPYLQGPGQNSINISWHDTSRIGTIVEYGLDSTLNLSAAGTSEIVSDPFRWHTVKLSGLESNTRYFYRVASGDSISGIYSFRTLPDSSYTGKLRFVLFSDTHCADTTKAGKVLRASKAKIAELYGPDIENHINGIFHSGDVVMSGNSPDQYTSQFFQPFAALSANIPTMAVIGNHEGESQYFYQYMKLDDQSVFPLNPALNEKIWQMKIGNSLFIGLNTNIFGQYGTVEANWLDTRLSEAENDTNTDFVFLFFHHPPFSELWFDVNTFDGGANYVKKVLFPVIKKYTKVQQLHTGHTHGFERGTIMSDKTDGDFRIICGGGGGGDLDSWGAFTNLDYDDIHIAYDHYCFQILEIDIANHSFQNSMFSLGDLHKSRNSEVLDAWYKKLNQKGPDTPVAESFIISDDYIQFNTSAYSGPDSLMSLEYQLIDSSDNSQIIVDKLVHWKNIYGVDKNYNPIDKNIGINLYQSKIQKSLLSGDKSYYFRARYRDHNLKWSKWSNSILFTTVGIKNTAINSNVVNVSQNYPNPFQDKTVITYSVPETMYVNCLIYDTNGRLLADIDEGVKKNGTYRIDFDVKNLCNGVYFYKIATNDASLTKKMIKLNQ
jgi:hypothetical protein